MTAEAMAIAPSRGLGELGGVCFRAFCAHQGANWYHAKAGRFYCETCAAEINRDLQMKGEPPACSKHR